MARPTEPGGWKIERQVGRGGQSSVYAVSRGEGTPTRALKLLRLKNDKKTKRFIQEARIHATLSSRNAPNVVPILEHNLEAVQNGTEEWGWLVMPLAECSLDDPGVTATLSGRLELCLEVFEGIVEGVAAAHQAGVIHRDLKPGNVLFSDRSLRNPMVADFGICFFKSGSTRVTSVDESVGAKYFMAPEQERGRVDDVKPSADVYALGKLLCFMLTGQRVFREEFESAFKHNAADDQRFVLVRDRLLATTILMNPDARIQDCSKLLAAVREVRRLIKGPGGPSGPTEGDSTAAKTHFDDFAAKISASKSRELDLEFDRQLTTFDEDWAAVLASAKESPLKSEQAARELITRRQKSVALSLAMARMNETPLYPAFKRLVEAISGSTEGLPGYAAVIGIPHVLAGLLYISTSVMALKARSWQVLAHLLTKKFEWHYQSRKTLYSYGFDLPYFFHSEAFERKSDKLHDFFRDVIKTDFLDLYGISSEQLMNRYVQAQMLMCLRAAQNIEQGEPSRVYADFGRFFSWRVTQLLEEMHGDTDVAKGVALSFGETPTEFFDKLNSRLKIVQTQMWGGGNYIWESIDEWSPHGPSAAADR